MNKWNMDKYFHNAKSHNAVLRRVAYFQITSPPSRCRCGALIFFFPSLLQLGRYRCISFLDAR